MDEQESRSSNIANVLSGAGSYLKGLLTIARGAGLLFMGMPWFWVIAVVVGILILFLVPLFISIILSVSTGKGIDVSIAPGPGDAAPIVGDGSGLIEDYCNIFTDNSCSDSLKILFTTAANWSKMPAGILAGLILKECGSVYTLNDIKVDQYSAEGAAIPHSICADSDFDPPAHGPAQFLQSTFRQNGKYHQAYNKANNTNRTTEIHNLADSIFAAAWYLKCLQITYTNPLPEYSTACNAGDLSTVPIDITADADQKLEPDDVYPFLAAYGGFRKPDGSVDVQGCRNQSYCESIYKIYEKTADFSATGAPWGWSTSGTMTQGPYDASPSHGTYSAIDIGHSEPQPVYATHDGNVIRHPDSGDGFGNYVEVFSSIYITRYAHLESFSPCLKALPNNTLIKAGTYLGTTGWTGFVIPQGPEGRHLHYHIFDDRGRDISEPQFNSLVPEPYTKGKWVDVSYSGRECILGP